MSYFGCFGPVVSVQAILMMLGAIVGISLTAILVVAYLASWLFDKRKRKVVTIEFSFFLAGAIVSGLLGQFVVCVLMTVAAVTCIVLLGLIALHDRLTHAGQDRGPVLIDLS